MTLTEEDKHYLRLAGELLADQIDAILDLWRGVINTEPSLRKKATAPKWSSGCISHGLRQ
jgi:hypothetical protein